MTAKKSCGSCKHFVKWKADHYGGGLCEDLDARTHTDHGKGCVYWKSKKYDRNEAKKVTDGEG